MRFIADLGLFTLSSGGVAFLVAAGLAYALAATALRGAGILVGGALAILVVMLAWASLASSSCDGCGIFLLFFASLQVTGWLLGAVLGWGLRWVFRR